MESTLLMAAQHCLVLLQQHASNAPRQSSVALHHAARGIAQEGVQAALKCLM